MTPRIQRYAEPALIKHLGWVLLGAWVAGILILSCIFWIIDNERDDSEFDRASLSQNF